MDIKKLIKTCTNDSVKALLIKLVERGDNLHVFANDDKSASGQYVVGHGGYTVTRK